MKIRIGGRASRVALHASVLALLVAPSAVAESPLPASLSGKAVVVDGDSIHVEGHAVRIQGIDAPESRQTCVRPSTGEWDCGKAATAFLEALADRGEATCEVAEQDRYGRFLASCSIGDVDVGAAVVRNGYAVAYRRYSDRYVSDEVLAKRDAAGIWAGSFVMPERWRRGDRLRDAPPKKAGSESSGDCRIKGNVSGSGRIYHLPGSRDYDLTKIDESQGERWFCSVAEAEAAGWRAPRR